MTTGEGKLWVALHEYGDCRQDTPLDREALGRARKAIVEAVTQMTLDARATEAEAVRKRVTEAFETYGRDDLTKWIAGDIAARAIGGKR